MNLLLFLVFVIPAALLEGVHGAGTEIVYFDVTHKATWWAAEQHCQSLGGHLAKIVDDGHNIQVRDLAGDEVKFHAWIGAHTTSRSSKEPFRWVSDNSLVGNDAGTTNWLPGQPSWDSIAPGNQLCVHFLGSPPWNPYHWNDQRCDWELPYFCEVPKPCTITSATANPTVLWPPNREWATVEIDVDTDCSSCSIDSITQNDGGGSSLRRQLRNSGKKCGNGATTYAITDSLQVKLCKERDPHIQTGRIYEIHGTCEDHPFSVQVSVPHDQSP